MPNLAGQPFFSKCFTAAPCSYLAWALDPLALHLNHPGIPLGLLALGAGLNSCYIYAEAFAEIGTSP